MLAFTRRWLGPTLWWVCLLIVWFSAHPASAQQDPDLLKKARAQFQQATELEQAGNYSGALQAFREVGQVKMTPQVRFHIALCEEKLGKLVAALGGYELAMADAEAVGPSFKQEVESTIQALRERIPKVVIERGPGAEAAEIELDGVTLGASSIGVEVPVDPGPHSVTATRRGFKDFSETFTVGEKEAKPIKVELEAVPASEPAAPKDEPPRETSPAAPPKKYGWVPWALGGVGVVSFGFALFFNDKRTREINELAVLCPNYECVKDSTVTKKEDDLRTHNTLTNVFLVTGVVAVVGGVALYLVQNMKSTPAKQAPPKTARRLTFQPNAPRSDVGFSLVGSF